MSEVRSTDDGVEYTASRAPVDAPGLCDRVEIEATANGGYTAKKHYAMSDGPGMEMNHRSPDTYAFTSLPDVTAFLSDAFGASAPPPAPEAVEVESAPPDDLA